MERLTNTPYEISQKAREPARAFGGVRKLDRALEELKTDTIVRSFVQQVPERGLAGG